MRVESPEPRKLVTDYDIVFDSGMMMPITIDPSQGDSIDFGDLVIVANLAAKPSLNDPTKTLGAEVHTYYLSKVACVTKREREVVELGPEAKEEWHKTFQSMVTSPTVQ